MHKTKSRSIIHSKKKKKSRNIITQRKEKTTRDKATKMLGTQK